MVVKKTFSHLIFKHSLALILFFSFCIIAYPLSATEYQPWLGNVYQFELRPSLTFQRYHWLSCGNDLKKHRANDIFLNGSLSGTLPDLGLEVEIKQARTRHQRGNIDQIKGTGRYVLLDDVAGDFITLTLGASYIKAFRHSLKDVSSFHHGTDEGELFISVGKENSQTTTWSSRVWGMFGVGCADRGSPWFRCHLLYEQRYAIRHELQLLLHSLWGLGNEKLNLCHFNGYGPVEHRSVDLGFRYTYLLDFFGSASIQYSYRIHAHNFPTYTHRIFAQILYTFAL